MSFLLLILKNLLGRPTRTALTVVGISVAVGAVISLVGISGGFERSLREIYEGRGIDLIVMQAGKLQQSSSVLPESLTQEIAALPGVAEVTPGLSDVVTLSGDDLFGVPVQAWPVESSLMQQFNIVEGRPLNASGERKLLLGRSLAQSLELKPGDSLAVLENQEFEVVGIFDSSNVFENGAIVMPLGDLQELMLREGEVTAMTVIATEHERPFLQTLKESIQAKDSGLRVALARDFAENAAELKIARSLAWMTSSIALLVGSIGVLNTMLMAVFERTGELAMMRAVGWRKQRVLLMVLTEAVLLALLGAIVGAIGAVVLTYALSFTPTAGRLVSGAISPWVLVQGLGIALGLGFLGGLYPAYRASQLTPMEGIRHD